MLISNTTFSIDSIIAFASDNIDNDINFIDVCSIGLFNFHFDCLLIGSELSGLFRCDNIVLIQSRSVLFYIITNLKFSQKFAMKYRFVKFILIKRKVLN